MPTVKDGGRRIVVWGCFAASETGRLAHKNGIMNSVAYQHILNEKIIPYVKNVKLGRAWIMQQDNDPNHTSRSTQPWFQGKKIIVLDWPGPSSDLNLIEMFWTNLKRAVHNKKLLNLDDLHRFCDEEWSKISPERCVAFGLGQ